MATAVPIVDFAQYAIGQSDDQIVQRDIDQIACELIEAFSSAGFVYLKNSGISDKEVSEVNKICAQFFTLPIDTKQPYTGSRGRYGWVSLGKEMLNLERTFDLKESFEICPLFAKDKNWPDNDVPGFQVTMMDFYKKCGLLTSRVLKAIGVGLKLEDSDIFRNAHDFKNGPTMLRALYYPGLQQGEEMKPKQTRCGEHTDFGSITLVFQDDVGGLQVQNKAGEYIAAPPIPDTVVINVADLMQRWTSDCLVSTRHRVMLPDDVGKRCEARQSLVFFVNPDSDYLIKCVDGTQKYEPITAGDYLKQRIEASYF